jgi:hypothetical protein
MGAFVVDTNRGLTWETLSDFLRSDWNNGTADTVLTQTFAVLCAAYLSWARPTSYSPFEPPFGLADLNKLVPATTRLQQDEDAR